MEKTFNNLCDSCTNIGCKFQSGIVRTECAFYMPPHIEPDNCGNYVVTQPTVEAIPKADYESKLKTDMVTMLEELKKEIIELPFPQREPEYMQGYSYCQINILDYVIQEKINELKENTDGSN